MIIGIYVAQIPNFVGGETKVQSEVTFPGLHDKL